MPFNHFDLKRFFKRRDGNSSALPRLSQIISHTISEKAFLQNKEELYSEVKEIGFVDQKKKKKSKLHMFFFQNPNFSLSSEIQSIIKLVLVLSHDQASVQHEFNINKIS